MIETSIIIPMYNAKKEHIFTCLSSIANSTYRDYQVILINDGSTNNCLKYVEAFEPVFKDKLIIIEDEHQGAAAARNLGIEKALELESKYIKFFDIDDYLNQNSLELMVGLAKKHQVNLVRGARHDIIGFSKKYRRNNERHFEEGIIDLTQNKDYIIFEQPGIGNKLYATNLWRNIRFPEGRKWEDIITPFFLSKTKRIYHTNKSVFNYRFDYLNTSIKDYILKTPKVNDIIFSADKLISLSKEHHLYNEYKSQLKDIYGLHSLLRIPEIVFWINLSKKDKKIINTNLLSLIEKEFPEFIDEKGITLESSKTIKIIADGFPFFRIGLERSNKHFINFNLLEENRHKTKEEIFISSNKVFNKNKK